MIHDYVKEQAKMAWSLTHMDVCYVYMYSHLNTCNFSLQMSYVKL